MKKLKTQFWISRGQFHYKLASGKLIHIVEGKVDGQSMYLVTNDEGTTLTEFDNKEEALCFCDGMAKAVLAMVRANPQNYGL